ncbi:ParB/RepB/Spo0J family partition protein [Spiroplasma tabanidicola]|uniref:Chromosome partitioning protein ParB n=1 Tax=Spiroplasma tabanidicola TaxID=324079 RepID=A0A6I6CAF0_9MOLU|nr:ParB/RepB/Spo0J family partition protein [Spiroplasma tabanidicola]QGS52439.1 chromosome partitioning protein ParB [Spiroplasma tabanidicola]
MAASKKKYNFKGLDDIFGESVTDIIDVIENDKKLAKEKTLIISVDLLKPNPYQPRKVFEQEELVNLAESIKLHGIIQPIIVNDKNEIVAGERRMRAAKLAGLKEVPVIVLTLSNAQMEEFAIIENIQRVDLTDIEEANAYKQLSMSLKLKQEEIAIRVGKSRSHIANIMRLLNLPKKVQDALLQKKITMGQAKPLLTILGNESLLEDIFQKTIDQNLTARDVENLVKNAGKEKQETIKEPKSPNIIQTENRIMRRLGTKVTIDNKKITIGYSSEADLNRVLEILGLLEED